MSDSLISTAAQFGSLGLIALAMGWFILYIIKMHKAERDEWRLLASDQHKESTEAINNNTTVLTRIETLISHKFK